MIRIVASGVVRDGLPDRIPSAGRAAGRRVARRSGECFLRAVCVGRRTRNASPFWRNGRMKRRSKRTTPRPISPRFAPALGAFLKEPMQVTTYTQVL